LDGNSLGEPCRGRYVPAADAERFIAGWELTRDYLISQPGYVDTALHQAVTPNADFQFVNIGRWQTAEDFLAATQSQGFREAAMGLTDFSAASRPISDRAYLTTPAMRPIPRTLDLMFIYKDADSRYVYEHADAARKR